MDLRKIKKLIEMLEESNLSELEIREGEESVRLSRIMTNVAPPSYLPPVAQAAPAGQLIPPAAAAPSNQNAVRDLPEGHVVRAPMVGTFYASQSPGQPALVKLGQQIKVGDTLGIIEAMKMFNPIESELAGVVVKVLVENGSPVEFDQPLLVIQ